MNAEDPNLLSNPAFLLNEEMEFDELIEDVFFGDSSEEEAAPKRGGSKKGRAPNKNRDFVGAYHKVVIMYFNGRQSTYDERDFERRFRCPRSVWNRIHDDFMGQDPFVHKKDATGRWGIYPLVKLVGCFRYIAYGDAFDRDDENLQIGESTLEQYCKQWSKMMVAQYGSEYLNRPPTERERRNISAAMAGKGFPGCLASWDCKHFVWKNCPMRLAGQMKGHAEGGKKTLILESISDHRRYLWHVNFGDAGSLNDINVLDKSDIVGALLHGDLSIVSNHYKINGVERDWMYFLVDGIYPNWSIFMNPFSKSSDPDKTNYNTHQEAARKDIECAFGILVSRFHVLKRELRSWYLEDIIDLLHACVILHNMVVEARAGDVSYSTEEDAQLARQANKTFPLFGHNQVSQQDAARENMPFFAARVSTFNHRMTSGHEHARPKHDLVMHLKSKTTDD